MDLERKSVASFINNSDPTGRYEGNKDGKLRGNGRDAFLKMDDRMNMSCVH